jgi:flagellar basal-body rod modification protein FlgD
MMDAIGPSPNVNGLSRPSSAGKILDKDDFLQLLVAQMRHQDPMNPMDGVEFAGQLAQFSSLEQLINIQSSLEAQGAASAGLSEAVNQLAALNVIGREVLTVGNHVSLTGQSTDTVTVGIGGGGGNATLRLFDESGREVATTSLGFLDAGRHDIPLGEAWAGFEPGPYTYTLEVTDGSEDPVQVQHFQRVRIDGVRYGPAGAVLMAGGQAIPLGDIVEVHTSSDVNASSQSSS